VYTKASRPRPNYFVQHINLLQHSITKKWQKYIKRNKKLTSWLFNAEIHEFNSDRSNVASLVFTCGWLLQHPRQRQYSSAKTSFVGSKSVSSYALFRYHKSVRATSGTKTPYLELLWSRSIQRFPMIYIIIIIDDTFTICWFPVEKALTAWWLTCIFLVHQTPYLLHTRVWIIHCGDIWGIKCRVRFMPFAFILATVIVGTCQMSRQLRYVPTTLVGDLWNVPTITVL